MEVDSLTKLDGTGLINVDGADVTQPMLVVGSAYGGAFDHYELAIAAPGSNSWTIINSSTQHISLIHSTLTIGTIRYIIVILNYRLSSASTASDLNGYKTP